MLKCSEENNETGLELEFIWLLPDNKTVNIMKIRKWESIQYPQLIVLSISSLLFAIIDCSIHLESMESLDNWPLI